MHTNGVGIAMPNETAKSMIRFWPISDRVIIIKFKGKPLTFIQAYAHTRDNDDDELIIFYEQVRKAIKYIKSGEVVLVMGDFKAKTGKRDSVETAFRLGERNDRGTRLVFLNK